MTESRNAVNELMTSLKQIRDELKLRVHLGNRELQDEWGRLEERFAAWKSQAEPLRHATEESAADVWSSLKLVGEELREGFQRIRKSL